MTAPEPEGPTRPFFEPETELTPDSAPSESEILREDTAGFDDPEKTSLEGLDSESEEKLTTSGTSEELTRWFSQEAVPIKTRMTEHRLLTPGEELALAKSIERGDLEAKDKLITHNLRLVYSIAREYASDEVDFDDLVQKGATGLIRAAEKFDYRRGWRFTTYANSWIRQGMQREIADMGRTIRISERVVQHVQAIHKQEGQGVPTEVAVAKSPLDPEEYARLEALRTLTPLDKQMFEDGSTLSQVIGTETDFTAEVIHNDLWRAFDQLSDREQRVVEMRDLGDVPKTYQAIGRELQISPEEAQDLHANALALMATVVTGEKQSPDLFTEPARAKSAAHRRKEVVDLYDSGIQNFNLIGKILGVEPRTAHRLYHTVPAGKHAEIEASLVAGNGYTSGLEQLDPQYRAVIEMRLGLNGRQQQNFKQIAQSIGMSAKTVATRYESGLGKLQLLHDQA